MLFRSHKAKFSRFVSCAAYPTYSYTRNEGHTLHADNVRTICDNFTNNFMRKVNKINPEKIESEWHKCDSLRRNVLLDFSKIASRSRKNEYAQCEFCNQIFYRKRDLPKI